MGQLHIIILKCESGHAFGGTVYRSGNTAFADALSILREYLRTVVKEGQQAQCPICHSINLHFHDEETPFDSLQDQGCRSYIDAMKKAQAVATNNPNMLVAQGTVSNVKLFGLDGELLIQERVSSAVEILSAVDLPTGSDA